jgi:putative tryptophan/tyrosine transport system substrate-binding protein
MHRELIVTLAARHRLPAVYAFRVYVAGSGLMFYGPNSTDPYRRAAGYVDRILKREKHALPARCATPRAAAGLNVRQSECWFLR